MKISIALATYNGEKYLQEQLDSFLAQTRLPDELVVSDDASSDATVEILKSFKKKSPFHVKIIENEENVGFTRNFERAIKETSGDIIFLSDQDDKWLDRKIELIYSKFLEKEGPDLILNDVFIADSELKPTGTTLMKQIQLAGGNKNVMGCASTFKKILKNVFLPIPNVNITHDQWLHFVAVNLNSRLIYEEPLQLYRRHSNNESKAWYSEPNSISLKKVLSENIKSVAKGNSKVINSLKRDIRLQLLLSERLRNLNPAISNEYDISRIQSEINVKIISKKRRLRVLNEKIMESYKLIFKMLIDGTYHKHFRGFKTFGIDMLRNFSRDK